MCIRDRSSYPQNGSVYRSILYSLGYQIERYGVNKPYQDELAFVKKVQSCADIARRDREIAETDTSGHSEEKREKQVKFPAFHAVHTEVNIEENSKAEQHSVNQTEPKPEKKTSLLRKLDEKKKECAERDAKQQTVKKKWNHEMSL